MTNDRWARVWGICLFIGACPNEINFKKRGGDFWVNYSALINAALSFFLMHTRTQFDFFYTGRKFLPLTFPWKIKTYFTEFHWTIFPPPPLNKHPRFSLEKKSIPKRSAPVIPPNREFFFQIYPRPYGCRRRGYYFFSSFSSFILKLLRKLAP